jgi:hypothetical protein
MNSSSAILIKSFLLIAHWHNFVPWVGSSHVVVIKNDQNKPELCLPTFKRE